MRGHCAIGLVLVGAGQVACLQPLGDVGRDATDAVELAARGIEFRASPLPCPPGVTHAGCHAQLCGRGAALDGAALGIGQGLGAASFTRQPQRDGDPCFIFPRAEIAVHAVCLGGQFQGDRLGRPGPGRLRLSPCSLPPGRQCLRLGLPSPGGLERRSQGRTILLLGRGGRLCPGSVTARPSARVR